MKTLPIKKALSFGWETTLKNKRFLIGVILLTSFIQILFNTLTDSLSGNSRATILAAVFNILGYILDGVITLGLIKISLDYVDGRKPRLDDLWWVLRKPGTILSYLGAFVLYVLMVAVWSIPLIGLSVWWVVSASTGGFNYWSLLVGVPFVAALIYFAIKYGLFSYAITDHHDSAFPALRRSSELTRGIKMRFLGFGILMALINLLGVLALVVGLLLTVPTSMLATAYIYRHLSPKN